MNLGQSALCYIRSQKEDWIVHQIDLKLLGDHVFAEFTSQQNSISSQITGTRINNSDSRSVYLENSLVISPGNFTCPYLIPSVRHSTLLETLSLGEEDSMGEPTVTVLLSAIKSQTLPCFSF